jgi:DNA-binding beta-propeller fold protein YncE
MDRRLVSILALVLAVGGQYWLGVEPWAPWLWVAALLLFAVQLRPPEGPCLPPTDAAPLAPGIEIGALAAVLAVAVFFRVHRLDLIPSGLNHDVAWNGLYALRILRGEPYTPYTAEAWGRETTMFYLQALGIRLFGVETPALIYPAVAAGIALVPIFYLWQRELFGARLALLATALLAVSGWHLVFSRIGWRAVLQPLMSTLAYWVFARAVRRRSTWSFCGAGAAVAAALYTYNAARLLPVLFPLFALYALARTSDRRAAIERWRRPAVDMTVCFAAVALPMAWYAATHWWAWQQRANATYFLDGHSVWDNLAALAKVYLVAANGDDFFVDTAVLEWPVAVLFVCGVVCCLRRARDLRAGFLLLGWLVAAIPAFLSTPNANRMIGTLPFAYAFAGVGAFFVLESLLPAFRPASARARPTAARVALAVALVVVAGASTWAQYFGPQRRDIPGFYPETTVVGRYARTLLSDYEVWIGGRNFPRETLDYLTYRGGDPRERAYTWLDDVTQAASTSITPVAGRGAAFILSSDGRSGLVFEQLRRRYPRAQVVDLADWSHDDAVFARALLLSPTALDAIAPRPEATPLPDVRLRDAGRGSAAGQFADPRGVAVGADGRVYVADTGNHRVQVFAADGRLTGVFGEHGATPGDFDEPSDIAVDAEGAVHVVDTWNNRVQKLDVSGFPLAYYAPPQGFFGPRGIAIADGKVYVTDTGGHRIEIFDTDGLYAGNLGMGEGGEPGQLRSPIGIAVDARQRIWVVDAGNLRLQVFAPNGALVKALPVPGWSGSELHEGYLAADGDAVLLTDPPAGKVWRVSLDGRFEEIASGLRYPGGIARGSSAVLVTERDAGHIASLTR